MRVMSLYGRRGKSSLLIPGAGSLAEIMTQWYSSTSQTGLCLFVCAAAPSAAKNNKLYWDNKEMCYYNTDRQDSQVTQPLIISSILVTRYFLSVLSFRLNWKLNPYLKLNLGKFEQIFVFNTRDSMQWLCWPTEAAVHLVNWTDRDNWP